MANMNRENEGGDLGVEVDCLCKIYGDDNSSDRVLDNFTMLVPSGAIYSLLGSSGCGKTTILSSIVGLRKWDSGTISVFGYKRGAGESLPREIYKRIGYMPQNLALYDHLNAEEIGKYFGKLYGIGDADLKQRWEQLLKLLELCPKRVERIENLSGGQKRRVSLALAFISNPDLLILDEPTVGLDPVLRNRIWTHLCQLTNINQTTILITTHYIEETRYSNKVGVMRNGRMLIEESPQILLSTFNSHHLQDVIVKLCKTDQEGCKNCKKDEKIVSETTISYNIKLANEIAQFLSKGAILNSSVENVTFKNYREFDPDEIYSQSQFNEKRENFIIDCTKCKNSCDTIANSVAKSLERTVAFSTIMWIYLLRQPIFAFILLLMPILQLLMTFFVVGKEPANLKVGVINYEFEHQFAFSEDHSYSSICENMTLHKTSACDLNFLSCPILNHLSNNGKLDLMTVENPDTAEKLIADASMYAYIEFPQNFSTNLVNRYLLGRFADDNDTLEGSKLKVTIEKSHYLAYHLILKDVLDALKTLSEQLESACDFDNGVNELPLHFRNPVYGSLEGTHQDSIMPAIVSQILFEILYGIAPMILIKDLKLGTFERASLAGLRFSEFMLGMFVTICPVLILQSFGCYFILEYAFNFGVQGSFTLFTFMCILAGLCGQGFGIFMGLLLKSEFSVIVSAIMVIPILMTCSGTLWPLEAHPYYLTIIYYIFPSAPIVSSLRSVISRGVGLFHALVWPGVLNTLIWSIIFWCLSITNCRKMSTI